MEPKFIRVTNDTILNISGIFSITRQIVHSQQYQAWDKEYQQLMKDSIEEYLRLNTDELENKSEDNIVDDMYKRFAPIIRKHLEQSIGPQPEPYIYYYKLTLFDGNEIVITEEIFEKLSKLIGVDMTENIDNVFVEDESIDD